VNSKIDAMNSGMSTCYARAQSASCMTRFLQIFRERQRVTELDNYVIRRTPTSLFASVMVVGDASSFLALDGFSVFARVSLRRIPVDSGATPIRPNDFWFCGPLFLRRSIVRRLGEKVRGGALPLKVYWVWFDCATII